MRTMIDMHLEGINNAVIGLTKEVHNRALDYVAGELEKRKELIERLLENGKIILSTTTGERWGRLYEKRHELYVKKWEINEILKIVYRMRIR